MIYYLLQIKLNAWIEYNFTNSIPLNRQDAKGLDFSVSGACVNINPSVCFNNFSVNVLFAEWFFNLNYQFCFSIILIIFIAKSNCLSCTFLYSSLSKFDIADFTFSGLYPHVSWKSLIFLYVALVLWECRLLF